MLACFAWTNLQIVNITNAKINLYAGQKADLYIRMGEHISKDLIAIVKKSGIYEHVFTIDPIALSYRYMKWGKVPVLKRFLLKNEYIRAYNTLMQNTCPEPKYDRVLMTWFYAENVFVINYWAQFVDKLPITLVEEGTGSYCYNKKELPFPMFMAGCLKNRMKRILTERGLARKYAKNIDTFCLYQPQYCQSDIVYKKMTLPTIHKDTNPIMHQILCSCAECLDSQQLVQYNKSRFYYFSLFTEQGRAFDLRSQEILETIIEESSKQDVIAKIHTGNFSHARNFAKSLEEEIYIDRNVYIFESLYSQIKNPNEKVLLSCASTATLNPKFMFGDEPYVIFTYRLYNTEHPNGNERDNWIANALIDSYEDKSRVMIPNSIEELREMISRFHKS